MKKEDKKPASKDPAQSTDKKVNSAKADTSQSTDKKENSAKIDSIQSTDREERKETLRDPRLKRVMRTK